MARKQDYSDIEKELDLQSFIESIRGGFKNVLDPRSSDNQDYSLMSLIIMILCAVIAGANSITAVHQYAKIKIHMFNQLIPHMLDKRTSRDHRYSRKEYEFDQSIPHVKCAAVLANQSAAYILFTV